MRLHVDYGIVEDIVENAVDGVVDGNAFNGCSGFTGKITLHWQVTCHLVGCNVSLLWL
ncbi:MAG: hypothetical protein LBF59_07400 [Prevotellaceae bacterium]|nr:hypothetical protein [Prevotellaceae bacterium]